MLEWGWDCISKYPRSWTSARSSISELGYAILDGREVWEVGVVEAAAIATTALGVL